MSVLEGCDANQICLCKSYDIIFFVIREQDQIRALMANICFHTSTVRNR